MFMLPPSSEESSAKSAINGRKENREKERGKKEQETPLTFYAAICHTRNIHHYHLRSSRVPCSVPSGDGQLIHPRANVRVLRAGRCWTAHEQVPLVEEVPHDSATGKCYA